MRRSSAGAKPSAGRKKLKIFYQGLPWAMRLLRRRFRIRHHRRMVISPSRWRMPSSTGIPGATARPKVHDVTKADAKTE